MYSLQVTGTSLLDCQKQIVAMADEIVRSNKKALTDDGVETRMTVVSAGPIQSPVAPVFDTARPVSPMTGPVVDNGLDAEGLHWDSRIHASTKEKNKDGKWKRRRGVDDTVVAQVTSEIKGSGMQTAPSQPVALPHIPTTDQRVALPEEASVLSQIPLQAVAPIVPQVAPPTNVFTVDTFKANIVPILNRLSNEGKISDTYIGELKTWFGKEIYEFATDDAKAKALFAKFLELGFVQQL